MWYIGNCMQLTVQYSLVIYNLLEGYETVTYFGSVVFSFSFPLSCVCNINFILLLAPFVFHLKNIFTIYHAFRSFIPVVCAECDDCLPFSGASSITLCYILFLATLLCQLFFHTPSLPLVIYFLVCLSILLFPNSYIILFWEFYFLPFSVHSKTTVIYLNLLFLL